jgi:error-prone DNA polymerase
MAARRSRAGIFTGCSVEPVPDAPCPITPSSPDYVELQVTTNFSFLRGASHPGELVHQAAALGHRAIAVTDRNTLAGIVRAHVAVKEVAVKEVAAKEAGLRLVVGCRLDLIEDEAATAEAPSASLLCYPTDRAAYGRLARLLTLGKRRAAKGECRLGWPDVLDHGAGQIFALVPPDQPDASFAERLRSLARRFPGQVHLAASYLYRGDDARRLARLAALADAAGAPLVAVNDVHYHEPGRRLLQDVLACIRWGTTIDAAGFRLAANAERHLKPAAEMARLFRDHPDAVARTVEIAGRCRFALDELRYEYPDEATEDGRTPQQELVFRTWTGAAWRYPEGIPEKVKSALAHELALIGELNYAPYFLTVWDIVRFARSRGILCQGRGSAANSAVCYCLAITAIDPAEFELLFERFVSAARNEPPDIDVDFEHERREEVIQYIYAKYGRERAGLTAVVISYRARSAVRDVGKAMGLSADMVSALTQNIRHWNHGDVTAEHFREMGVDPNEDRLRRTMKFACAIEGFPRHLSQHVGGFVMTRGPLCEVVPIENAAMAERTVIEWDKDDLDALGILKVDVLALGMLTCVRKAFDLIARHGGQRFDLASVPKEDPAVYDMLCRADSLGVFQVESRAQMSMLPRLKPRTFYDLVIEVAIVRPGPIQGNMVHPYLRRREGKEPVEFPSKELEGVLGKTLGVPLFQEQAMNIAIVGAGFKPEEADRLRRAMATFKRNGDIHRFRGKFVDGMVARNYDRDFAERCFSQIEGFSTYGFPESHAASFALLVYVSSWLKCRYPAVFAAALLNSQPMGFYAPAQIVRDARDHGVELRDGDVNQSAWDCTLEKKLDGTLALRLGFRQIAGFSEDSAGKLVAARGAGYGDPHAVWRRAGLSPAALETLARADAWRSMGLGRREALWAIRALGAAPLPLFAGPAAEPPESQGESRGESQGKSREPTVTLPAMTPGEAVVDDYRSLRLTLRQHPLAFLRAGLMRLGVVPAGRLIDIPAGGRVTVAGLVLVRQQPGSAKGIIFVTLEDETGIANLIVRPDVFKNNCSALLAARLMGAFGRVQREGIVIHVLIERIYDWSLRLHELTALPAHADEVKRPPERQSRDRHELPVASRDFH